MGLSRGMEGKNTLKESNVGEGGSARRADIFIGHNLFS